VYVFLCRVTSSHRKLALAKSSEHLVVFCEIRQVALQEKGLNMNSRWMEVSYAARDAVTRDKIEWTLFISNSVFNN
jgi:hypothetical protein